MSESYHGVRTAEGPASLEDVRRAAEDRSALRSLADEGTHAILSRALAAVRGVERDSPIGWLVGAMQIDLLDGLVCVDLPGTIDPEDADATRAALNAIVDAQIHLYRLDDGVSVRSASDVARLVEIATEVPRRGRRRPAARSTGSPESAPTLSRGPEAPPWTFIARGTWLGGVLARYPGAPEVSKSDAHLMFRWYVSQIPQWLAEFDRVCARRGLHLPTGGFEGGVAVIDWIEEQCRTGQVVVELCDAARLARVRELVSGGERRFHCCPVGESSQCLMHLADVYLFQQIVAVREAEWVLLNERNGGDNGAPAVARTGRKRPLEEAALLQWQPELAAGPVRTIKPDECKERWRLLWETFPPRQP